MAPPSSEVALCSPFSSSPRAHRGRKRAGMVAIPPALRPAWRRRLLLRLLLPLFLAVSLAAGVARADEAAHPTRSPVRDENVFFDAYEWPVGPALEGLPRASANEDEGLLVATSSSSSCDGRDAALLRVSPWPGCGAQVTLALGWNVGSADDDDDDDDDAAAAAADDDDAFLIASLGAAGRHANATIAHVPQDSGMSALALAMPSNDPLATTAVLDTAVRLLDALPRTEIVSVWALSNTYGRPRPELLADFRELRLGGRRHAAGALRAALAAASAALGEGASTTLTGSGTDGDRVEDEAWSRSTLEVLRESSRVLDHAEGPVARDLIVISPRVFDVYDGGSRDGGGEHWEKSRGLFGGGRWFPSLLTVDRMARNGSVDDASALASRMARRRRRIYRAGLCGADAASRSVASVGGETGSVVAAPVVGALRAASPAPWSCPERRAGDAVALFVDVASDVASADVAAPTNRSSSWCPVRVPLPSGAPTAHLSRATCVASAAATDEYPYPAGDAVTLRMDDAERADFDDKRSFLRGTWEEMVSAKRKMSLAVELGLGEHVDGSRATAKFRGVSSFRDCVRKSLAVNLKGKTWRRLSPGAASDKFLLVSMCYDDRYLKTARVLKMAKAVGAFPHATPRYVRLLVENRREGKVENHGLYLLMADPTSGVTDAKARPAAVVRRRNDAYRSTSEEKGRPDVKFPKVDGPGEDIADALTLAEYDNVARVALTCEPEERCFDQLDRVLDVNQYLRWLALMTFVDSGDHVDEAWFYASDTAAPESLSAVRSNLNANSNDVEVPHAVHASWRFETHAWDPDDSFQSCHHGGENALPDPHGTLKCAEGDVDNVLLRSRDVYARYMDWLEWTLRFGMDRRTATRLAKEATDDVFAVLADDDTAFGLAELRAANSTATTSAENARDDIRASGEWYSWLLEERRRVLLRRVGAWREKSGILTPRIGFFANFTTRFPRTAMSSGAGPLELSFDASERAYDAGLFQELVLSGVRLTNRGRAPARVFDSETGASRFVVRVGFDPTVVYRGRSYVARAEEFVVACWNGRDVAEGGIYDDPIDAAPRCDVRTSEDAQYVVRPSIGNATVSIGFESVPGGKSGTLDTDVLCGGCELELGTVSLHHKHWLGFEDGIVGENADGTRAFAFEYERSDDSYPARGGRNGREPGLPPRAPRRRRRRVRVRGDP